ncbi:MAG: CHAD domain-containing protein [Sphingobacteriales bacterium]|nr:CHAD domain-containing protein [Sphingobacteriales bacterium]
MEDIDLIYQHWKKEQHVFNQNLAILKKHNEKDAVHDLRVAVKKLRAFIELYVLLTKEPLWEYPLKETEELFSVSGKQRDIEIALDVLGTLEKETGNKFPELKKYLQNSLAAALKWTNIAVAEYKKKELEAIALLLKEDKSAAIREELKFNLASLINKQLGESKNYFREPHKLRQYLKEIYYWIKIAPENWTGITDYDKEMHLLLDDLGQWQDLEMFNTKARHFRKDHLPKTFPEYQSIKTLHKTIADKEQELLKAALSKAREVIKKAMRAEKEKSVTTDL